MIQSFYCVGSNIKDISDEINEFFQNDFMEYMENNIEAKYTIGYVYLNKMEGGNIEIMILYSVSLDISAAVEDNFPFNFEMVKNEGENLGKKPELIVIKPNKIDEGEKND